jgi:uroporphyrinogen decarboxylase
VDRKQRFMTALRLEEPDSVPLFDFLFQQPIYEHVIGRRPGGYNGRDAVACALGLDHDGVSLPLGAPSGYQAVYLAENVYLDEWGTTYQQNESAWPIDAPVAFPLKTRADLCGYRPPDPTLPGRASEIEAGAAVAAGRLALTSAVTGPFTTAWLLMGLEGISIALAEDPAFLTDVFRISNEFAKEAARLSVAAGVDCVWIADDFGDSRSGFLRTEKFRKYVFPYVAELAEYIAALGVPVLLHSCGHIWAYLDDIAQTPIVAVNPLQRTAGMDLARFKEKYGRRFCIIGNIDSSRTLPFGTPDDVAAEVREAIDIAAPGGGFILASDHSLHDGISVENILEMFRVGREYGSQVYAKRMPASA